MKHSPKTYAQMLVGSSDKSNTKTVAKNFWHMLQKNKQYKDLGKILEEIDQISAKSDGKILVKVFCDRFEDDFDSAYGDKIEKLAKTKVEFKKIVKIGIDSPVFIINDEIIDLSSKNLVNKLQIKLSKIDN